MAFWIVFTLLVCMGLMYMRICVLKDDLAVSESRFRDAAQELMDTQITRSSLIQRHRDEVDRLLGNLDAQRKEYQKLVLQEEAFSRYIAKEAGWNQGHYDNNRFHCGLDF